MVRLKHQIEHSLSDFHLPFLKMINFQNVKKTWLPKHTLYKLLYYIWQSITIILFYLNYFFSRLKLSEMDQKYFIYTFFIRYLKHVGSLLTNLHIKKFLTQASRIKKYIFFPKNVILASQKLVILGNI